VTDGTDSLETLLAERLDGMPWPWLLAAGPAAFVAGYALTVLIVVLGPSSVSGGLTNVLVLLVFLFYSAHNVPLEVSGIGRLDWLSQAASPETASPDIPVVVFYSIPMLVLLGAGVVVAVRVLDRVDDPARVAAAVACLGASYALVAIGGTFVFTSSSVVGGSAQLVLADAALYGLAYPLVFGTFGAALAGTARYVRDNRSTRGR
jgi:hypothetical protein